MHHADAAEMTELFVGSPYFMLEGADSSEMTREWVRRQMQESATRLSSLPRQSVESAEPWQQQDHVIRAGAASSSAAQGAAS